MIPFYGIKRQYAALRDEMLDAADEVYTSGIVLDGENTAYFEYAMAKRCDRAHAISVNSGTMGLLFALQSRDPERDNRGILIPAISFVATLNTALLADEFVAVCDVNPAGLIDLNSLRDPIRDTVDTIMYVNLFGNTVDYDRFRVTTEFFNDDMFVIEDAAQSFGASYKGIPSGKMGDISVLSFDPTKNLNNYGSGGMVLTDDVYLAECVRNFKDNGKESGHEMVGTNNKMSEIDCAQMLIKLKYFDDWQRRRTEIAAYYIEQFGEFVDIPLTPEGTVHAWSKFAFRTHNRSKLRDWLYAAQIDTKIHYERALYDEVAGRGLLDPIYPELTDTEVEHIAARVRNYFVK
jgi:dTDP-4-amino-4,6-dideoxygalactose transaminase